MNVIKSLTALCLTASIFSIQAFAQQTTTPATQTMTQASVNSGVDIYVDGTLVASGAVAYSNTIVTLGAAGSRTVTAFQHGAAASTAAPVYSSTFVSTRPDQVIHVVIGGTMDLFLY